MKHNHKQLNSGSRRRADAGARLLTAIDLPPDAGGRLPYITVTGNSYVCVGCHCGILQLSPQCVRLYTRIGIVRIDGREMAVSSMDNDCIRLSGKINAVTFEQ